MMDERESQEKRIMGNFENGIERLIEKDSIFDEDTRKCRICGCSDYNACPGGCYWVEIDLCSCCTQYVDL